MNWLCNPHSPTMFASNASTQHRGIGGLMNKMREYLQKHRGCQKCHRCNVNYISEDCPNGFPNPATYWGITLADGITLAADAPSSNTAATATAAAAVPASVPTASSSSNVAASSVNAIATSSLISSRPVMVIASSAPSNSFTPSNETCIINVLSDNSNDKVEKVDSILNRSMSLPPFFKVSNATVPFSMEHLIWHCSIENCSPVFPVTFVNVRALIDDGSHLVLIWPQLVQKLNLCICQLPQPIKITVALKNAAPTTLTSWVKLKLYNQQKAWTSCTVHTIVVPDLCSDIILGLPFLTANNLIIDPTECSVTDKLSGFDLLHPPVPVFKLSSAPDPILAHKHIISSNAATSRSLPFHMLPPLETTFNVQTDHVYNTLHDADVVTAVCMCIEVLKFQTRLTEMGEDIKTKYKDVFEPIKNVDELPTDVTCSIKLKNADKQIAFHSYSFPRKYHQA